MNWDWNKNRAHHRKLTMVRSQRTSRSEEVGNSKKKVEKYKFIIW